VNFSFAAFVHASKRMNDTTKKTKCIDITIYFEKIIAVMVVYLEMIAQVDALL
jgi:hypothetical protein